MLVCKIWWLTAIPNIGRTRRRAEVSQLFLSETVAFTIVVFELICKERDNYYYLLSQMDRILHIVRKNNDRLCVCLAVKKLVPL